MTEKLILLGTGHATVTKCYNTCFAVRKEEEFFLVDAGGGNGILAQLEKAEIPLERIHHIFLSHEHTDHILGMVWMIRMIGTKINKGKYDGKLHIYCHSDLCEALLTIVRLTLQGKLVNLIGDRILLHSVEDGQQKDILGYEVTFFDINSTKAKQYGFTTKLANGKKFTFLGDEPYRECEYEYAVNADWLLHEAFCLDSEKEIFQPYEKHHTTAADACKMAQDLGAKNVILYHTEDKNLASRKELYTKEGQQYFKGNLFVPDDLETYEL
ncbi:ribonuclease Z [Lachnospiraceae bacterium KM106-2]|nr:ribonuclease Z [Lachnospiraceae bacterium KM106-2]